MNFIHSDGGRLIMSAILISNYTIEAIDAVMMIDCCGRRGLETKYLKQIVSSNVFITFNI